MEFIPDRFVGVSEAGAVHNIMDMEQEPACVRGLTWPIESCTPSLPG